MLSNFPTFTCLARRAKAGSQLSDADKTAACVLPVALPRQRRLPWCWRVRWSLPPNSKHDPHYPGLVRTASHFGPKPTSSDFLDRRWCLFTLMARGSGISAATSTKATKKTPAFGSANALAGKNTSSAMSFRAARSGRSTGTAHPIWDGNNASGSCPAPAASLRYLADRPRRRRLPELSRRLLAHRPRRQRLPELSRRLLAHRPQRRRGYQRAALARATPTT